jgi:hypothetical protein
MRVRSVLAFEEIINRLQTSKFLKSADRFSRDHHSLFWSMVVD